MKVKDIVDILDKWAPFDTKEDFDNVGLLVGNANDDISGILIALDITLDVIAEAKELGANLIITHHPIIFDAMKDMTYDSSQGKHCQLLAKYNISVISSHTNLDKADGGISDIMAQMLGLEDVVKVESTNLLRVGQLPNAIETNTFIKLVEDLFEAKKIVLAGKRPSEIKTVCVLGGSGGSFIEFVSNTNADVYLIGSAKHEDAITANTLGVFMMCAGHYETEVIVLPKILAYLQKHADVVQSISTINISKSGKNPFDIMV